MLHKSYIDSFTEDDGVRTLFDRFANFYSDGISFEGSSAEELRTAFGVSVDDYLVWCAEEGKATHKLDSEE